MSRFSLRFLLSACLFAGGLLAVPANSLMAASVPSSIPSCQYVSDNTHPLPYCGTGQTTGIVLATNTTATYTFNYPGDESNITFTASLAPIDPSNSTAAGFNVFDATSKAVPPPAVEVATIASDGLSSDPHGMQFNYSSATNGSVTLQAFNYTPNTVTFNLSDSGLMLNTGTGSVTTAVTLQLASAPGSTPAAPTAPTASVAAAPAPAAPKAASSGTPATIPSCQYTSDNTHPLPFCSTGQTTPVQVASNASVIYKFNYPGDNSNITVTAMISPLDAVNASAAGFTVYDTASKLVPQPPVEVATVASNGLSTDAHSLQFNYSSGTPGPVTFQLFNYTPNAVTFNMSDSGLVLNVSGGSTTAPVTLQLS